MPTVFPPSPSFRLLRAPEIRARVRLDPDSLAVIEAAFAAFAQGDALMPVPMDFHFPAHHGEAHVKSAWLRDRPVFVIKVASGFYDNPGRGLPSSNGLMLVLSAETGTPLALLQDEGYLTDVRTALAGALAAKYLAPRDATVVGIIGAGLQARLQLEALVRTRVRSLERAMVWSRRPEAAARLASEMRSLDLTVEACASVAELMLESQLVVTTTPAREPLIGIRDLHPGLHITAIGADLPGKQELHADVLAAADLVVCDRLSQARTAGELQHAVHLPATELGDIIIGKRPGRQSPDAITVCDLTGLGVQDAAIAELAYRRCLEAGCGTVLTDKSDAS